jgi:hypothetical protein
MLLFVIHVIWQSQLPNIGITAPLAYLGTVLSLFGLFLILAGLGIINVGNISVAPGRKTWGFGIALALMGIVLLLPEFSKAFQATPTPTTVAQETTAPPSATLPPSATPTNPPTSAPETNTPTLTTEPLPNPTTPLSNTLLHLTFDSLAAISNPQNNLRGITTLTEADLVAAQTNLGGLFTAEGKVAVYRVAQDENKNINLDRGEVALWYRPNRAANEAGPVNGRTLFRVAIDGYNPPALQLQVIDGELRLDVTEHFKGDGGYHATSTGADIPLWQAEEWVHIRASWNNTNPDDSLQLFINNTRRDLGGIAGGWVINQDGVDLSKFSLFIGAQTAEGYFVADGIIDEFIIRE